VPHPAAAAAAAATGAAHSFHKAISTAGESAEYDACGGERGGSQRL